MGELTEIMTQQLDQNSTRQHHNRETRSEWRHNLHVFLRPKAAKAGLIILAVVLAILLVGPFVVKFGPYQTTSALNQAPTLQHPFGTDYRGRDVYSQIIYGAFETLHVSFLAALGAVLLGTVVGVFSGYFGKLSGILTAANETILAFPAVPFLILLLLLFGANDVFVISVLILVLWAPISRALRPQVMSLKGLPYIDAAKMSGMSDVRIVFRTIIPSIAPISLAYFILQSATAVIITTGLQFFGNWQCKYRFLGKCTLLGPAVCIL